MKEEEEEEQEEEEEEEESTLRGNGQDEGGGGAGGGRGGGVDVVSLDFVWEEDEEDDLWCSWETPLAANHKTGGHFIEWNEINKDGFNI